MTPSDLIQFEREAAEVFDAGKIKSPLHLSGGNELALIDIFKDIRPEDYVFSGHRSHYHALLKGVPRAMVMERILAHRSMNLAFPKYNFYTSAIVGGCLPIAVGVAAAIKREPYPLVGYVPDDRKVWCFIGDMGARTGIFHEALAYSQGHDLPIWFVIEDNGLSTDTPTREAWGNPSIPRLKTTFYRYERTWPHVGVRGRGSM